MPSGTAPPAAGAQAEEGGMSVSSFLSYLYKFTDHAITSL